MISNSQLAQRARRQHSVAGPVFNLGETPPDHNVCFGQYVGVIACHPSDMDDLVTGLDRLLDNGVWTSGVRRHSLDLAGTQCDVVIKTYPRQWWRDAYFRRIGSKARTSYDVAKHLREQGVGAPPPIAAVDRWHDGRLMESHYLYRFEPAHSFAEHLDDLLAGPTQCHRLLALMEAVAAGMARMHDAGVCHFDLGNQNVLVDPLGEAAWHNVRFIDFDRARFVASPTFRLRARDLSRVSLPSGLLHIFHSMYFGNRQPPNDFAWWERHYRKRFELHTVTRPYRHPFRTLRKSWVASAAGRSPTRQAWVWDDRSEQAIGTRTKRDRYASYPWRNLFCIATGVARHAAPSWRRYKALMRLAFTREVKLKGRIGMAVGGSAGVQEPEQQLLSGLPSVALLVRLHRHAGDDRNGEALAAARRLRARGHPVFIALLQDRASVDSPMLWKRFVETWLPPAAQVADGIEIGHAVNRVKWGIERFTDYRRMVEATLEASGGAPEAKLTGPAVIDFEYHYLVGLLAMLPNGCFDALSHHLYVDRRGAPENRQGRFSCVEKFALAKAIAGGSAAVKGDRLIVSEVNWPIIGTGAHSPIAAPYVTRDYREAATAVDEETYADFMLRYYALALCSGFVEQVYWWRLAAHGFGLVDDQGDPWRPRPAFKALQQFVRMLGDATFVGLLPSPPGTWSLRFRRPDSSEIVMAWAHPTAQPYQPRFSFSARLSRDGTELPGGRAVTLGGSPVYFVDIR